MKRNVFIILCMLLSVTAFAQKDKRPDTYNYNRAMEAIENKDTQEAFDYLGKELNDNPKNGYAYSWLAYLYRNQEEYGHAISSIDKALQYLPKKDTEYIIFSLATRAQIYQILNEYDKALADYNRAIKVDDKNTQLYKDRAQLLYEQD